MKDRGEEMPVFISYSRKDADLPGFQLLLSDLSLMRRQIWLDERLTGGQAWWDEILKQIRECDAFLFVLSKKSLKSEACRRELAYAVSLQRPILPVRLVDLSNWQLPEYVARAEVVDYSKRAQSGESGVTFAFSLRDAVDEVTIHGARPLPDPLPPPPDIPVSYLHELQPLLEAKELPLAKQEQFVHEVRGHLDDEDEDRKSLAEALHMFRSRADIAYKVAVEVDELLKKLTVSESSTRQEDHIQSAHEDPELQFSVREPVTVSTASHAGESVELPSNGNRHFAEGGSRLARFDAPGIDVMRLAQNLRGWYESQNYEAQTAMDGTRAVVQCRSKTWSRRLGAGAALTVVLAVDGEELAVEIGGGKWMDKVAAAGVAWFVLWPALIPAAMGGYKQAMLPSKTLQYIQSMIPLTSSRL
jgi:TIR domain